MKKGFLYAILAVAFSASAVVSNKYLLEFVNPRMLAFAFFASLFISSSIILVIKSPHGFLKNLADNWKDGLIVGGLNGVASLLFFISLELLDASTTTFLVRFSTVFIILIGVIFLREKLTKYDLLGIFFAVGGAFLINYSSGVDNVIQSGLFVALAAAFVIALHNVAAKVYVKKIGALQLVNVRVAFTSGFLLAFALATDSVQPLPLIAFPILALTGSVLAVAGFVFFYKALELEDVSKVATIRTLDPFVVIIYGFIIFRTFPGIMELLGGSLIVLGVIIITLKNRIKKLVSGFRSLLWLG